ncbi:MAG: PKD domain-containing protein, partial [Methylococcales bacterium]|nr:PKD domain-containing protein [Methylococcales bacterium]
KFTQDVNTQGLCGFNDWRMPASDELRVLVYCSSGQGDTTTNGCQGTYQAPTINSTYFPNTPNTWFWSASVYPGIPASVPKSVSFAYGHVGTYNGYLYDAVRLVRNGQSFNVSSGSTNVSPIASFTATPTSGSAPLTVNLDASASTDPDGSIVDYNWTSTEGTSVSTGKTYSVTFYQAGIYTITLTATDNLGARGKRQQTITVNQKTVTNVPPIASFTATPTTGNAPLTVNLNASASIDSDGIIKTYAWSSSDGNTGTDKIASFTFNQAGTFTITLTVTDNLGATVTQQQTITVKAVTAPVVSNKPPVANFTATPTTGKVPLTVNLNASASSDSDGAIKTYSWSSSDGNTDTDKIASFTYSTPGTYTITLTVTDNLGATGTQQQTITVKAVTAPVVSNKPPVANFTATPTTGKVPLTVNLDASSSSDSDGTIKNYAWSASNGNSTNGKITSLNFANVGSFTITLTVTDDQGATSSKTSSITVNKGESILGYNETARAKPQIIMAGVSPSEIDIGDTSFDVLALVRPGILPLQNVTVGQGGNPLFSLAMQQINTLANGDQFWKMTFAFARGTFGNSEIPLAWGSSTGQYFIQAIDQQQQVTGDDHFPTLTFANAPAQNIAVDTQHNDKVSYLATKRLEPQVIMAGVTPAIIDITDTSFDIVALVRTGALPIQNVLLKQGGNVLFSVPMSQKTTLSNGDGVWVANYAFLQGAFGIKKMPIAWGSNSGEFSIQVIDSAQKVPAVYPTLKSGNHPAQQ